MSGVELLGWEEVSTVLDGSVFHRTSAGAGHKGSTMDDGDKEAYRGTPAVAVAYLEPWNPRSRRASLG